MHQHLTPRPLHKSTIIFVHHFGGNSKTTRRHQKFVSDLGFNSVSFDLSFQKLTQIRKIPFTTKNKIGFLEVWSEEVEKVLTQVPGKKIVYSLSMPSAAAVAAISARHAQDIEAWICDGGPFVETLQSMWNYLTIESKIKSTLLKIPLTAMFYTLFKGPQYAQTILSSIKNLPAHFPVLSIRYWQDQLVTVSAIEKCFEGSDQIDLEVLSLPEGAHLQGIQFDEYKRRVAEFLDRSSS